MGGLTLVDAWSYMEPVLAWKMFILLKINQPKQSEALDPQAIGSPTSKAVYRKAAYRKKLVNKMQRDILPPFNW